MKKTLALLVAVAVITVTLCVHYIKPDQSETAPPASAERIPEIVLEQPSTEDLTTYGGIAYDFETVNAIKTN